MLSPIKESRRENGSNQELRCSPERWSITSASPTHSTSSDINGTFGLSAKATTDRVNGNSTASLGRYHIVYDENGTRFRALKRDPITRASRNFNSKSTIDNPSARSSPPVSSSYLTNDNAVKLKGSSRIRYNKFIYRSNKDYIVIYTCRFYFICYMVVNFTYCRCTEKILNQLELHANRTAKHERNDERQTRDLASSTNSLESKSISNSSKSDPKAQSSKVYQTLQKVK